MKQSSNDPWGLFVDAFHCQENSTKASAFQNLLFSVKWMAFLALFFLTAVPVSKAYTNLPSKAKSAAIITNSLTADLALVKTVNDNTPDQNQVITFTLVVSNAGPDPATSFEVTDVVPAGMTYLAGSMTGPGTYVNGAPATTGLKWQNLFLQNGGSLVLTFQATVTAAGGTAITNFAQVTSSAEADPDSTPNNGNIGEDDGDSETVTVNIPNPPVVLTCPVNTTTAACQTQAAVNAAFNTWLATASGSGGCNGILTNNNTGAPSACGGSTTVTFSYTSTCAPLTTTCQATFTVAAAPTVVLTCPSNTTAAACQTQAAVDAAFATWLATASASGGCNGAFSNNNTGAPSACGGSTTVTFTYTSTCSPLTSTCQATFTVSAPSSPTPVFANCTNNTINLGCNPSNLPSCAGIASGGFGGAVTASNSCGSVPVNCSAGSIAINGCTRTQVFTFDATACGLTVTCTRTFTWNVVTPPSFNGTCGNGVTNLGCNPATLPACDPNVTASNECGPVTVTCNVGAIIVNGCNRQQTLLYVANAPGCGNFSTCQRVFNWQVTTAPVFGNCDNTVDLGCNPATLPSCANINQTDFGGAITATNECGNVSMSCTGGPITVNGCNRTQVFTITATACGLTSTCTRTFTWTVATAPVFDNCTSGTTDLGCDPAVLPSCDPAITATNECGAVTVNCTAGAITVNGCNRSQVFTYTATACGLTSTCARTFTWKVSTTPVLTCPTNTTVAACQTQAAVNAQFAAWLATASFSGACNGVLTNNNTGAPSFCGGSATVTFTLNSDCQAPVTCQATFTVTAAPPPSLTCPNPLIRPVCQTRAQDSIAMQNWVNTSSFGGGCNGSISYNGFNGSPPSSCGGTKTLNLTYTSSCAAPLTCSSTFTIPAPTAPVLTCPTNTTVPFGQTQAQVNAAFATWLATASGTGGCNGLLANNNAGAPPATGGSVTVTFFYSQNPPSTPFSGACPFSTITCQATFTVSATPPVVLTCPTNTTVAACQTQAAVNAAFATWLATASGTGGCNGVLTNNNTGAPAACGGSTTVTFTYTSTCAPLTTTCQATFTVPAPPPVSIICPVPTTVASCQTQAAINAQYAAWLATFNGQGGCNLTGSDNGNFPPSNCGEAKTVTFTLTSTCAPLTTSCQSTFTVTAPPPVVLTCPTNTTVAACQTQAAVNTAFATWLATVTASGGCNGVLTNNNTGAPAACGGSTTVTFTYTSSCAPTTTTCQATFTVPASPTVVLTCPTNTTAAACQTQAAVNAAFATWLATATASGGCNGVLTNNNTGAPSACGGSTTVTFTYTSSCSPLTTTCQATFTVLAAPTVVLTCPTNTTAAACQTQAAVNSAFATWLSTASASGGCNGVLTNNNTGAPSACGGSTTVTFTYTSTCSPLTTTCQATFTVASSPVVLTCPTNTTTAACQTQAAVNSAFATWLSTASASGGCNGVLTNNNTGAPSACGGSTTVTFTYTSSCSPLTTTCQATFTVAAAPTVVLTCPINTTVAACQTQAAVNTAFATWLATATATGGCNGVLTNNNTGAPSACGGSTTVTFTYTSTCAPITTTCQATFTVAAAPTVVLTCPTNTTAAACQTQAAVNAQFAAWLATASASGGCNGVLTNNNTGAPSACGGSTTVTFSYTSSCAPTTTTCQATFTVAAPPTVVLTCPTNTTEAACQTQAAVNSAFATWLATASASGGCNGVLTNNNTGAPSACGGSTTVVFTYTSSCAPTTTTCTATFTVAAPPTVVLTCPIPTTASACLTQAQLDAAYNAWLATATASGGCNGVLTNDSQGAPSICSATAITRTVVFTYTSSCAPTTTTCTSTFTVPAYPTFTVPANGASTVACPALIVQPAPPTVVDGCGITLTPTGPVITNNPNPITCEGTRTFVWTYTDCSGHLVTWSHVTTVERLDFTVPANGSATVACPANATQPTPPVVLSNCGETITPTGPVITNVPNPLTCEGTRTYTWTYTDCEGNSHAWSFIYTIERLPFTVPANGSATVACPANATQPVPPTVLSNCGEVIVPVGPVITNVPNPLTCEGTRTYAWTYTDCEGNTATWSFTYTIERQPFTISAPNGSVVVDCPDDTDVVPTPPVVTSNCGEVLTPVITSSQKPICEGVRNYYFTYTDCEGNTATWQFRYNVEYLDFTIPASTTMTVECPINVVVPTPPTVLDNCGKTINPVGPVITSTSNSGGCEASRTYAWSYKDCEGNSHAWSKTFVFAYTADFFPPADEEFEVACLLYAQPPFPQTLYDNCGKQIAVSGPTVEGEDNGCSGWRKFTYVYTDCGGHSHPWSFTYYANDNEPPVGQCPDVDVTDLGCIDDVPCPEDNYDFSDKIEQLLEDGDIYDVCSGDDLNVKLDSWTALWECSDADNDGVFTFGRTFYFRISDACGNEFPSLCGVTYSGICQPIETFPQVAWGIGGGEPGNDQGDNTTDLQVISSLLDLNNPIVIGGANRSLTVNDAACVVNLLPGTSAPTVLGNCHQVNCTGCNAMGIGGLKNSLAANAIALELNLRYNVEYNEIKMIDMLSQSIECINLGTTLTFCPPNGADCVLRIVEKNGVVHVFPNTIGGLIGMVNLYLNGGLALSLGQSISYAQALNSALISVNDYWHDPTEATVCGAAAGVYDEIESEGQLPIDGDNVKEKEVFYLSPNPSDGKVNLKMAELDEAQDVSIEVYNRFGQLMLRKDFGVIGYLDERLDLRQLNSGLYIISLRAGSQRFEQKLILAND